MRWSTGAFAALGGITAAVATGGTALRSPVVVDRLNDWAARRLTVQQRADPYAAILPTPISGDDFYGDPGDLGLLAPGEVVRGPGHAAPAAAPGDHAANHGALHRHRRQPGARDRGTD